MVFWCRPNVSSNISIGLLQIVVVCNVTDSGEELLHRFIFLLLHAGEIGDNNTVVSLDSKVLDEGSLHSLVIIGVDLGH